MSLVVDVRSFEAIAIRETQHPPPLSLAVNVRSFLAIAAGEIQHPLSVFLPIRINTTGLRPLQLAVLPPLPLGPTRTGQLPVLAVGRSFKRHAFIRLQDRIPDVAPESAFHCHPARRFDHSARAERFKDGSRRQHLLFWRSCWLIGQGCQHVRVRLASALRHLSRQYDSLLSKHLARRFHTPHSLV